jgi:hypothetical protein
MNNSFKVMTLPQKHFLMFGFNLFSDSSDVLLTMYIEAKGYMNNRKDIARARVTAEQLREKLPMIEEKNIDRIAEWLMSFSNRGE